MPTLESLQTKRSHLVAQLEQHVGQINRINGAVALLDDLILEAAQPAPDAPALAPEMLPILSETGETDADDAYTAPAEDAA